MRILFLVLFILITFNVFACKITLSEIRQIYMQALNEESACDYLLKSLGSVASRDPSLTGYYGACMMVSAKYSNNPFKKLSLFNKGKEILESAIKNDFMNAELRFLRLGIQNNAPSFLGYNDSIEFDKLFLMNSQATLTDPDLKKLIRLYLVEIGTVKPENP